jgi:CRISP-associated protein Cas1
MSRVVHIGDDVGRLRVRNRQLLATFRHEYTAGPQAPLEDLDLVVVDSIRGLVLDVYVLQAMLSEQTCLVVCDTKHMPAGILMPLAGAWDHTRTLHAQIEMSSPRRKRAWQQVVQAKIRAQANNLQAADPVRARLLALAAGVRSGDAANAEATAARSYWPAMMSSSFRRRPGNHTAENGLLDFGYAVIRSVIARSVVGAGLHPALGFHHSSRSNPFCLADDLMEPIRPAVDALVKRSRGAEPGEAATRQLLSSLLQQPYRVGDRTGSLNVVADAYLTSVRRYVVGEVDRLAIPTVTDVPGPEPEQ